ncbi:hypothetical protein F5Y01DRAFT_20118 [Xylaria sp. FL0043]|nr:hypothetical protein F5Y01DRAFT_20118 [Xylaria sp. FL0043]
MSYVVCWLSFCGGQRRAASGYSLAHALPQLDGDPGFGGAVEGRIVYRLAAPSFSPSGAKSQRIAQSTIARWLDYLSLPRITQQTRSDVAEMHTTHDAYYAYPKLSKSNSVSGYTCKVLFSVQEDSKQYDIFSYYINTSLQLSLSALPSVCGVISNLAYALVNSLVGHDALAPFILSSGTYWTHSHSFISR